MYTGKTPLQGRWDCHESTCSQPDSRERWMHITCELSGMPCSSIE